MIRFRFEADAGMSDFAVQSATRLAVENGWAVESEAIISEVMAGEYQVSVPLSDGAQIAFYRIQGVSSAVAALSDG